MAESEQRLSWEQVALRQVTGALRDTINAHGPITEEFAPSAAKRVIGQCAANMRRAAEDLFGPALETYHARQRANAAENAMRATPTKAPTTPASTGKPDDPALVTALLEAVDEADQLDSTGLDGSKIVYEMRWERITEAARRLREARGETP